VLILRFASPPVESPPRWRGRRRWDAVEEELLVPLSPVALLSVLSGGKRNGLECLVVIDLESPLLGPTLSLI
jgi:hypothetical protein